MDVDEFAERLPLRSTTIGRRLFIRIAKGQTEHQPLLRWHLKYLSYRIGEKPQGGLWAARQACLRQ